MRKRYLLIAAVVITLSITSLALGAPLISSYFAGPGNTIEPVLMIFFGAGLLALANYGRKKY